MCLIMMWALVIEDLCVCVCFLILYAQVKPYILVIDCLTLGCCCYRCFLQLCKPRYTSCDKEKSI